MRRWQHGLKTAAMISGGAAALGVSAGAIAVAGGYWLWRRRREGMPLAGKVVLISGGSRGLGFAIANEFLHQGARVAICARDGAELERAAARLRGFGQVITIVGDITQPEVPAAIVREVERRLGQVDVMVNNAGVMQVGPWNEMGELEFRQAMDLHFWAPLRFSRAVIPAMVRRREGRILNIASIGGVIAVPHMLPYSASKFALVGLSQGLRSELLRYNVRVTTVCPWLTRTGSQENIVAKGDAQKEFAWFAASGSLPLVAQKATRAARCIVRACRAGQAQLVLTLPGKLAAFSHGVAPGVVSDMMGIANRVLPKSAHPDTLEPPPASHGLYNAWTEKLIRPLIRREGAAYNQPAAEPPR